MFDEKIGCSKIVKVDLEKRGAFDVIALHLTMEDGSIQRVCALGEWGDYVLLESKPTAYAVIWDNYGDGENVERWEWLCPVLFDLDEARSKFALLRETTGGYECRLAIAEQVTATNGEMIWMPTKRFLEQKK